MMFYGIHKVTLLDFPEKVAATLFTGGCNLTCPFCHNPELVNLDKNFRPISFKEILQFLNKRKKVLQGVCITGGEPLLHKELPEVIQEIQTLGFSVKLDTNGTLPENLKKCKPDYIAMDIKTSFDKYSRLGYKGQLSELTSRLKESIEWIIKSGINHEFRTTVVPALVEKEDITKITAELSGAKLYVLAQFRAENTLDKNYESIVPYPKTILFEMKKIIEERNIPCMIRADY